jgi:hypothetical protein
MQRSKLVFLSFLVVAGSACNKNGVDPTDLSTETSFKKSGGGHGRGNNPGGVGGGGASDAGVAADLGVAGGGSDLGVASGSPDLSTVVSSSPDLSTVVTSNPDLSTVVTSNPDLSTVVTSNPDLSTPGGTTASSPFIDTSNGIHAFLTFDYHLTASQVPQIAPRTDYIWGGDSDKVAAWHAANPKLIDTMYMPFNQDGTGCDINCWKASHPDWVLYLCDRTTPSTISGYSALDLDFSNPAVQSWQMAQIKTAASQGYDGIAFDNFWLDNRRGACGIWRNGVWVQLYNGTRTDAKYTSDVLTWLHNMYTAMHSLPKPMLLVPNYIYDRAVTDPQGQQVIANIDAALNEEASSNWGYNETDGQWLNITQWASALQQAGKAYYAISGFTPLATTGVQWALSTYLMEKAQASAVYIGLTSGSYGTDAWRSEYTAPIGRACGAMTQQQQWVYVRTFATGLAVTNIESSNTYQYTLPAGTYTDLYGNAVSGTITLAPHSGIVLLKQGSPNC